MLCICGNPLNLDDSYYSCDNCEVYFLRYVHNGNGEIDLFSALNQFSKDHAKVLKKRISENAEEVNLFLKTYAFTRLGKDWSLSDIKETQKVWEDVDPNIISDEIQLLLEKIDADFYFINEW